MQKLEFVDTLRGLAIIGVVIVHVQYAAPAMEGSIRSYLESGARGVQLFYVASAFTLLRSWRQRNDGSINFYIRRFFRIAPLFYVAIVAYALLRGFAGVEPTLTAALFINGWMPSNISGAVPGGWSVAVEMTFYLIFPLLMVMIRGLGTALLLFAASTLIAWWQYQWVPDTNVFNFKWIGNQLPVFAAGFVAYFLIERFPLSRLSATALGLASIAAIAILPRVPLGIGGLGMAAWGAAFASLLVALANGGIGWLNARWLRFVGVLSYGIYLVHFAIVDPLTIVWWNQIVIIPLVPLTLGASVLIAWALAALVERPGIALGKRLISSRAATQLA